MIDVYRVQFDYPPHSEAGAVLMEPFAPICIACAAGYHDQPMLAHESCDCPCHGTPPESGDSRIAA